MNHVTDSTSADTQQTFLRYGEMQLRSRAQKQTKDTANRKETCTRRLGRSPATWLMKPSCRWSTEAKKEKKEIPERRKTRANGISRPMKPLHHMPKPYPASRSQVVLCQGQEPCRTMYSMPHCGWLLVGPHY